MLGRGRIGRYIDQRWRQGVLFVECRRRGERYEVKKEIEKEDGCNEVKCKGRNAPDGTRRDLAEEVDRRMRLGMKSRGVK